MSLFRVRPIDWRTGDQVYFGQHLSLPSVSFGFLILSISLYVFYLQQHGPVFRGQMMIFALFCRENCSEYVNWQF